MDECGGGVDGGFMPTDDDGRGAGDFDPAEVLGVIGRMIVGLGEWESGREIGSGLGLVVNVSAGVTLAGEMPIGVLIVRCRMAAGCEEPV